MRKKKKRQALRYEQPTHRAEMYQLKVNGVNESVDCKKSKSIHFLVGVIGLQK